VADQRTANVTFANELLETEITQRNARKDAQENTARGLIVTAGVVLTLLIGLANDVGLFSARTSPVAKSGLIGTILFGTAAAVCSMGVLWPRPYERLGRRGLMFLNDQDFLDRPTHEVTGQIVATRIAIATTMDDQHENKAKWLKWSFRFLAAAFAMLVLQAVVLVIDPPPSKSSPPVRIVSFRKALP
jgi:hypothetical protein